MIGILPGLVAMLLVGVPIALALAAVATIFAMTLGISPAAIGARLFSGIDSFILMAVPLFVLAGALLNDSGMTERLIRFVRAYLYWMYASLAQVNVTVSMVFGGMTGIATADTAAVGPVMIPTMKKDGYKPEFATALTMASSLIGPIIPPSVPFLIYAVVANQSVGAMFLAGAIPGALIGIALLVYNYVHLKSQGFVPAEAPVRPSRRELVVTLRDAAFALVMPLIVIGGIVGGIFTPTEAAGVAVGYVLIVAIVVYRSMTVEHLWRAFVQSTMISAGILLIVTGANLFGWVLTYARVPARVAEFLVDGIQSRWVFFLALVVILVLAGLFLETTSAIIILAPLLLPAALSFGFSATHFGVMMVFGLVIGLLTPPVGLVLFIGSQISGISIERLSVAVLPFLALLFSVLVLIAAFPPLAEWLPSVLLARP